MDRDRRDPPGGVGHIDDVLPGAPGLDGGAALNSCRGDISVADGRAVVAARSDRNEGALSSGVGRARVASLQGCLSCAAVLRAAYGHLLCGALAARALAASDLE